VRFTVHFDFGAAGGGGAPHSAAAGCDASAGCCCVVDSVCSVLMAATVDGQPVEELC